MLMLAGWLVWLGAGAPSVTAAGEDRFQEPLPEFALELNDAAVDLPDGRAREVTVGGKAVRAALTIKPTRLVQTPDLSFRFPRELVFHHEVKPRTASWVVIRRTDMILLVRVDAGDKLTDHLGATIKEMAASLGEPKSVSPTEITLGGRTLRGKRAQFAASAGTFESDMFMLPAGKASYVVALQAWNKGGEVHPVTRAARQMFVDSLTLGAPKGPTDKAPFEFTLSLGETSVQLTEAQALPVTVGSTTATARVILKDTRLLRTPELSLRYPGSYEFEGYVDLEDGSDNWAMEKDQQQVMLIRTGAKDDAAKMVDRIIEELASFMGPATRAPVETTFAGAKRRGTRAEFKKDERSVRSEIFPFSAGQAGYVLAFRQVIDFGLDPPFAHTVARKEVERSLTIAK